MRRAPRGRVALFARWLILACVPLERGAHQLVAAHQPRTWPHKLRFLGHRPITSERRFRQFGRAHFEKRYLDIPITWSDIARHDKLGRMCEPEDSVDQCGEDLVCRRGICRRCMTNKECPGDRVCHRPLEGQNTCVMPRKQAWLRAFTNLSEFFCTVLIFFASALAAASGTGGGGMFVPIFLLFSDVRAEYTIPLSQCMILCGSIMNLCVFVSQRHPEFPTQPKIDYNCAILLEPMLMFGVTLGVVCNQVTPHWVLVVLLAATLGIAFWRTSTKGIKQWREESRIQEESKKNYKRREGYQDIVDLTNRNAPQVVGMVALWFLMLCVSFHGLPQCSFLFASLLVALGVVLCSFTLLISQCISRAAQTEEPRPILWASQQRPLKEQCRYPLVAFAAGAMGGLLGLGGGIVMSPVLLEVTSQGIPMHSEAVQATTATFVLVSSSLATIQYTILGMQDWDYAIWYSATGVVATLLGQWACSVYVRRYQRYSAITLSIAGVLLFSMIALLLVGVMQVYEDWTSGGQMGFSTDRLCNSGGHGIVTETVRPVAQRWEVHSLTHPLATVHR